MAVRLEIPPASLQALVAHVENPINKFLTSLMQLLSLKMQAVRNIRIGMKESDRLFIVGDVYNERTFLYTAELTARLIKEEEKWKLSDLNLATTPKTWSVNLLFKGASAIIESMCNEQLNKLLAGKIALTQLNPVIVLTLKDENIVNRAIESGTNGSSTSSADLSAQNGQKVSEDSDSLNVWLEVSLAALTGVSGYIDSIPTNYPGLSLKDVRVEMKDEQILFSLGASWAESLIPVRGVGKIRTRDNIMIGSVDIASPLQAQVAVEMLPRVEDGKLMVRILRTELTHNSLPNFLDRQVEATLNEFLRSDELKDVRFMQITVGPAIIVACELDGKAFTAQLAL